MATVATMEEKPFKTILSTRGKNLLLFNIMIKRLIADATGKSEHTIHRWIQEDCEEITMATPMEVIRKHTGLTDDILLQKLPRKK